MAIETKKRIDWIDIYKCIVIILVVVGHSTGLFNKYIYQFHMAAFFFISGYTSSIDKKRFSELLVDRFFTYFIPICTIAFGGIIVMDIVSKMPYYSILFPADFYQGLWSSVKLFFVRGELYVQFLGAFWFVPALLGITILSKIQFWVTNNRVNKAYIMMVILFFYIGYQLVYLKSNLHVSFFNFVYIFIGQLFFNIGVYARNSKLFQNIIYNSNKIVKGMIVLVCMFIMWYIGNVLQITVDYPSEKFSHIIIEPMAALNGCILICIIAIVLDKALFSVKKVIIYIGKNTMGIIVFHFVIFKICKIFFYYIGIMNIEDLSSVTPPAYVGNIFWPFITVVSIIGSLLLWEVCKRIPVINFIVGTTKEKYIKPKYEIQEQYNKIKKYYDIKRLKIYMNSRMISFKKK